MTGTLAVLRKNESGTYSIPQLDGLVYAVGNDVWEVEAGLARFGIAGTIADVDRVIEEMFDQGVPHTRISRNAGGDYHYVPWDLTIRVDPERSYPAAGNAFVTQWDGVPLLIHRLTGFREWLRLLDPPEAL